MSNWKLIHLNFRKNLAHFGEIGIGIEETSERVKSDTLFSAWITSYARLFKKQEVENLLQKIIEKPNSFRHSSTFIYQKKDDNKDRYFLPKPLVFPNNYPVGNDLSFAKTYRKIDYLPLTIWTRWYQKEGFTEEDKQELIDKTQGKNTNSCFLSKEGLFSYGDNFKMYKTPKVAVDRMNSSSNFYHTGFVKYNYENDEQHSGLYFLINFADNTKDLQTKMCAALHLLAEEGIGGERSSGAGRFFPEWLDLPQQWQQLINFKNCDRHSLISLFWQDNITSELVSQSYYNLQDRGGWINSPFSGRQLRRKKVRMFGEGSVFPSTSIPQGELADVTPTDFNKVHRIYRSGISLSLPIQAQLP